MSKRNKNHVKAPCIQRRVTAEALRGELEFIETVPGVAQSHRCEARVSLGLVAVELARAGEMYELRRFNTQLAYRNLKPRIEDLVDANVDGVGDIKTMSLGQPQMYYPEHERPWIGVPIIGGPDSLTDERRVLAGCFSGIVGKPIVLPPRELYLNIVAVKTEGPDIDQVLGYVAENQPETIDLFEVRVDERFLETRTTSPS